MVNLKRKAVLRSVPLKDMKVREGISQRYFKKSWANDIASKFVLEAFEPPTVNKIGSVYWVINGQHELHGLRSWLVDWEGHEVDCWVYVGLTEKQEANLFHYLNHIKPVHAFEKFVNSLTAEFPDETKVDAIVRAKGLKVARDNGEGHVRCVTTLLSVYHRGDGCLARDLDISYQAFGNPGLDADMLAGLGLFISRYDELVSDKKAIFAFQNVRGGVNAMRHRAERLRQQMGATKTHCMAATATEKYNKGSGGKKLPSWWKSG